MKAFTLSAITTLFAGMGLAHPISLVPRDGHMSDIDITILQFALTLEHLENEFYKQGFRTFTLDHFLQAGFSESFFLNLHFIAVDEAAHVEFLQTAITGAGAKPVAPCHYNFPVTDVHSFVTLSAILESVGTSAYLGAAPFVTSKDILGAAGSILVTEALHTSLQRSSLGGIGAPDPFGTPLNANAVFTLAAQFITMCPPDNAPLPFMPFPGIKIDAPPCFDEQHLLQQVHVPPPAHVMPPKGHEQAPPPQGPPPMPPHEGAVAPPPVTEAPPAMPPADVTIATVPNPVETSADVTIATAPNPVETPVVVTEIAGEVMAPSATESSEESSTESATESAPTEMAPEETSDSEMMRRTVPPQSCPAPSSGTTITLQPDFGKSHHDLSQPTQAFVTFISGLNVVSVAVQIQNGAVIVVIVPPGVQGQVFIVITLSDLSGKKVQDGDIVFGPAIMEVAPAPPVLTL